ncbi:hypothetical protein SAMN05421770_101263 [Granulicella rosea]|uniref:LVIVD repeat-containing protein n=1 Tax=Granulicella rosea TaxID=474952 RepID=A0A239D3Z0_9BACT|nr:hypothetical protein SAMN05421770_101263 [Granulicella rosea]
MPGLAISLATALCSCGTSTGAAPQQVALGAVTSVTPSATGVPNAVATVGSYEFVSVQGTGQIFTYNVSTGAQVFASVYATPCKDPSGMVVTAIGGVNVLAVVCYDTGSLVTLTINGDGSLTALGSVGGLGTPYPGTALSGTDVLIPIFGKNLVSNGGVAKVSIATPAAPAITGMTTLASPVAGGYANPGFVTLANGYIYVAAGSESLPVDQSSTIQVVNEATMTLVGSPLTVAHSPQQIAVANGVAFVTFYDAAQLESIDVSNPASMKVLGVAPLTASGSAGGSSTGAAACNAIPVAMIGTNLYAGCYDQATVQRLDVSDPTAIKVLQNVSGIVNPQRLVVDGAALLVPSAQAGGAVYRIGLGAP